MIELGSEKICIIGAGPAGVLAALMLDKMGHDVTLINSSNDIITGASQIAFIFHDGSEYLSATGDSTTTQHCVDGMLAFWQMFPPNIFKTDICSTANPARFFMSEKTASKGEISLQGLYDNADVAKKRYRQRFERYCTVNGLSPETAAMQLFGLPGGFNRRLKPAEFNDVSGIIGGVATSAAGINMPIFYAYMKALLAKSDVKFIGGADILDISKTSDSSYTLSTNIGVFEAGRVIASSGHSTPKIIEMIDGQKSPEGAYFLNCMTKIRLPKLSVLNLSKMDKRKLVRDLGRINFTLRDEGGCSFICVAAPTEHEEGFAVSYYPTTEIGNQIKIRQYMGPDRSADASSFDEVINRGLPKAEQAVRKDAILGKLCELYPFLKGYITTENMSFGYGSVFSKSLSVNPDGLDRSIRSLSAAQPISDDGRVFALQSPKFTTAVVAALELVDAVNKAAGLKELPKSESAGYGATGLDISKIAKELGRFTAVPLYEDAVAYAKRAGLPERMIKSKSLTLGFFAGGFAERVA